MKKSYLLLVLILLTLLPAQSYTKRKLTAVIQSTNLSKEEYKELRSFAKSLGKTIKKNWFPKKYQRELRTVVKISIGDNYREVEVREQSGDASFDQSCQVALERSSENLKYPKATSFEYLFEYKYGKISVPFNILATPFRIGAGLLSKSLGLSTNVFIPIF